MKDISASFLEKLTRENRKIDMKTWIDWNDDNAESPDEIITSDIDSLTVDKKLEGKIGVSVVDKATITINNSSGNYSPKNADGKWAGNVLPTRYARISAGVDGDMLDIFDGRLESIKPQKYNTSITIKDNITLLQKTKCPNKFYHNTLVEDIIKEWLDDPQYNISYYDDEDNLINPITYTSDTLDSTNTNINYNFNGMTMWNAILKMAESLWAKVYMDKDVFYFKTKLSTDYQEQESQYTFSTYGANENIWEISEELSSTDIYNSVEVKSSPYLPQSKQVVWTGAEKVQEVTEEYSSDKIENNELQLTYVPNGQTTTQPTKNVPIVSGAISVLDIYTGLEYTISNGGITVDYDTGLITFSNTTEYPTPPSGHQLKIVYKFYFTRLVPDGIRHFYIDLENPTIDIENLVVFARDIDTTNSLNVSFSNSSEQIYVEQDIKPSQQKIEVTITNNSTVTAELYSKVNDREYDNLLLKGVPFKQNVNYEITEIDSDSVKAYKVNNTFTLQNDLIISENKLKQMAQYLLYEYSTPKSKLKVKSKGVPHLEMMDKVTIEQLNRDSDIDFIIKGIKHKLSNNGTWDIELELEQANTTEWVYNEKGTPVLVGKRETSDFDTESPTDITGFNATLDGVLKTGMNRVKLTWNSNTELDLDNYYIYRKLHGEDIWTFLKAVRKGTTEYIDTSIIYNGEYDYTITAVDVNKNESSISSAPVTTITVSDTTPPAVPEWDSDNPAEGMFKAIYLRWKANDEDDIKHYNIYRSTNGTDFNYHDKTSSTKYKDNDGLEDLTEYWYKITAVDLNDNESDMSVDKSATTILIQDTDLVNDGFQITPSSDPSPSSGTFDLLWDGLYDEALVFNETNTDGEVIITFEYPMMWFFDMVKFRTDVNCDYYVQVFLEDTQSWINVAGTSGSLLNATGGTNTITEFDKRVATSRLRIIFDRAISLYELKFTSIVLADEILANNLELTGDMKIKNENGSVEIGSDYILLNGSPPASSGDMVAKKPEGAKLWHFDRSLVSTDGLEPDVANEVDIIPDGK
ncbi:MAG: fibronectin type III domain-containing protein, partial [bacterium]